MEATLGITALVQLGYGWKTFDKNSILGQCALTGTSKAGQPNLEIGYRKCTSSDSLATTLNISNTLMASFDIFEDITDKSKFFWSLQTTDKVVHIVCYARNCRSYQFEDAALAITPKESTFFDVYGDKYVSDLQAGGEYYGVYSFQCRTSDEVTDVENELKVVGIGEAGMLSDDFSVKLRNVESKTNVALSFDARIFGFDQMNVDNDVEANVLTIAKFVYEHEATTPYVTDWNTRFYDEVKGWNPDDTWYTATKENANNFVTLAGWQKSLKKIERALDSILAIYRRYEVDVDSNAIADLKSRIASKRDQIVDCVTSMRRQPTVYANVPKKPEILNKGVPSLSVAVVTPPGKWGGEGGNPFNDVSQIDAESGKKLSSVMFRAGSVIDQADFGYDLLASKIVLPPCTHGGGGGSPSNSYSTTNQSVTKVTVRCADYPCYVKLEGTNGMYIEYPQANAGKGTENSYRLNDGIVPTREACIGFIGRADKYVDKLQPFIVRFNDITWMSK